MESVNAIERLNAIKKDLQKLSKDLGDKNPTLVRGLAGISAGVDVLLRNLSESDGNTISPS